MRTWRTSLFLIAALACAGSPAVLGQQAEPRRAVTIRSYEIGLAELPRPEVRRDSAGVERSYDRVYVVHLKGDFGAPRAIPVDIWIGDYKVEEYGGTEEGIYFKVYDEGLFDRLENQPIAWGLQGQKVATVELRFTPSRLMPFQPIAWPPVRKD